MCVCVTDVCWQQRDIETFLPHLAAVSSVCATRAVKHSGHLARK